MAGSKTLDVPMLEGWLWEAACVIRGPVDAPKFKDYILPLVFLKRLSDVFEDEVRALGKTAKFVDKDHSLVRFYVPENARWEEIAKKTTNLGEYLTDAVRAIARHNPRLQGVIDATDFNATAAGQRIVSDERLRELVQILGRYRLGVDDVESDIFGRAYEYLLRKFAEGQGQAAGEFYTPREVAILMSHILDPEPGQSIYDPCCGSGGLLIKAHLRFREKYGDDKSIAPLSFFGQEINPATYAISRMNTFIYDMEAEIRLGNTMTNPAFTNRDGSLKKFDIVTANPMWNQDFTQATYEHDTYERFRFGIPPSSSADWGWVQHMFNSLTDEGKMAVVLDTGAVSRGSGNQGSNRERDIRKHFVEQDLVECVVLLPENLFYNTTAPGMIMVINRAKRSPGEILLINASKQFEKGRPKNFLTQDNIQTVGGIYLHWKSEESLSTIISSEEAIQNDYNLSPSRYVATDEQEEVMSIEEAVVLLKEAEEERKDIDDKLNEILVQIGLQGLSKPTCCNGE